MATTGLSKRDASSRNGNRWLEAKREAKRRPKRPANRVPTFAEFEALEWMRGRA